MEYHKPVLLEEVIAHLKPEKGKRFIDCTLGDGGHAFELLKHRAEVLGIDIDENSVKRAEERIGKEAFRKRFKGVVGNFRDVDEIAKKNGYDKVNGVLYDLGYSSYQLEYGELGLSFQKDEPLDMRLDKNLGVTAADLVNSLSEKELENLIRQNSDERYSRKFAKAIVKRRSLKKFQTTKDLADLLEDVAPSGYEHGRIHPATRTFQSLRIAVNDEVHNLQASLPRAAQLLLPGGLLVVISFHSLEDRVAKQFGHSARPALKSLYKKLIRPMKEELEKNIRARSARMRVFVRK
jgi:16S rRNA (cytosine1402-N4)-methyltransferase